MIKRLFCRFVITDWTKLFGLSQKMTRLWIGQARNAIINISLNIAAVFPVDSLWADYLNTPFYNEASECVYQTAWIRRLWWVNVWFKQHFNYHAFQAEFICIYQIGCFRSEHFFLFKYPDVFRCNELLRRTHHACKVFNAYDTGDRRLKTFKVISLWRYTRTHDGNGDVA